MIYMVCDLWCMCVCVCVQGRRNTHTVRIRAGAKGSIDEAFRTAIC